MSRLLPWLCLATLLTACAGDITEVGPSTTSTQQQSLPGNPPPGHEELAYCGDGICGDFEDEWTCPWDCSGAGYCGDGLCGPNENAWNCETDCGVCGDGVCGGNEDVSTCPYDCGYCGDGVCSSNENASSCPSDCPSCGDGICNNGETTGTCPGDCGTSTGTTLGRFSRWCGKVNTHRSVSGSWTPDPDCRSGCDIGGLTYCKKFWPASTVIRQVALTSKPPSGAWVTAGCGYWFQAWNGDDEFECVN